MDMKNGVIGFVSPESINTQNTPIQKDAMNPQGMEWKNKVFHINFLHYMLHIWQRDFGKPSRHGYHNTEYVQKAEEIGLTSFSMDGHGGKKTGQKIFHNTAFGGQVLKFYYDFPKDEIQYQPLPVMKDSADSGKDDKTKYQCQGCGFTTWGKPNELPMCFRCFDLMILQKGKAGKQSVNETYEIEQEAAKEILPLYREKIKQQFLQKVKEIQKRRNNEKGEKPEKPAKGGT